MEKAKKNTHTGDRKATYPRYGINHIAKKSLGQNFLKSKPALAMMCQAGSVSKEDTILEIGPGKGALTEKLLETGAHVIAIEKDRSLVEVLQEKFTTEIKNNQLKIIVGDCLEFDETTITTNYKIIANIPYNITGAIFKKFLSSDEQPQTMVLLIQKEVAERIVARDKKENILSLSVKAYGTPTYIMKVGKRFFSPSPKVDSAIIKISDISRSNFRTKIDEERFFEIMKASFAHKRKVLRKNLESVTSSTTIDSMLKELDINPKTRAEDLSFFVWLQIALYISTRKK